MSGQGAGLGIKAFRSYVRRAALRRVDNKPVVPIARWFIVRGDTVMVRTGRDRGKTGKVTEVLRKKNRVVVAGVNVRRRVFKSATGGPPTLKALESPLAYSNVNLVDPATRCLRRGKGRVRPRPH
jgi:large subunit ribosomal protein L24